MEINPYEARMRILQQIDGVQMQREAAPDAETAGCPGCPYFWTCPVPHRGEEVKVPDEIEREDVVELLGERPEFRPHDESDVGWTDRWINEDDDEDAEGGAEDGAVARSGLDVKLGVDADPAEVSAPDAGRSDQGTGREAERVRPRRRWFRRR